MNIEMHGKKIAAVYWPDSNDETGRCLVAGAEYGDLHLSATHHGDHDEFWIVQTKAGEEVARHNPKFAETIRWA